MTQLLRSGLGVAPVLTRRLKFSDHERAFETVRHGERGRIILGW